MSDWNPSPPASWYEPPENPDQELWERTADDLAQIASELNEVQVYDLDEGQLRTLVEAIYPLATSAKSAFDRIDDDRERRRGWPY